MFKNLRRAVYLVPEVEKAKAWYAEFLGREPAFDSPMAAIFTIGESSLSLAKGAAAAPDESGRLAVYWEVDDVDAAYARLLAMGAVEKALPKNILTIRTASAVDPFGNVTGLSGKIKNDESRTIENQPSETAHAVALCRALASYDEREELRRPDRFSEWFLKEDLKAAITDSVKRKQIIDTFISPPLYAYFIARTAFIDGCFAKALQDKVPQIVFLGAGYDTRALRFRDSLGDTLIFETDAPSTQTRKRALLRESGIALPEPLRFVPVNFKTEDMGDKLKQAGFDKAKRTLFIWEGVMYYLPAEAVTRTLQRIHDNAPGGSGLCFDFMTTRLNSINSGEPFQFWIESKEIRGYLESAGFKILEHLNAAEMRRRYLSLKDGTPALKPLSTLELVYAERHR